MISLGHSASLLGVEALPVEVEVKCAAGLSKLVVVGLPDKAVSESRDRVSNALSSSGFKPPRSHVTINLAPADVKKEGSLYDLPIALGMLVATEQEKLDALEEFLIVGELALSGAVRPIRGALSIAVLARKLKKRGVIVPAENAPEAAVVRGVEVYGVRSLRECSEFLAGRQQLVKAEAILDGAAEGDLRYDVDFAEVKGQHHVKRALEVAAAGGHNVLMIGPPGSGKTLLSKRLPTILPPLTLEEAIETTKVHSIAGLLKPRQALVAARPFRSPHHTISDAGLIGGTAEPRPGEVCLAHNGVLFLDELPEFKRNALEVMRQPLEDGRVTISRAASSMTFPCRFMLVAAMNPTPTGSSDSRSSPAQVQKYLNKISSPLLDRIDIHVEVPALKYDEMRHGAGGEASAEIRKRVVGARRLQSERFHSSKKIRSNAQMGPREIKEHCALDGGCETLLRAAMNDLNLSARGHDRILKVARTIADLAGSEKITTDHIGEAVQYRSLDRTYWV